MRSRSPVLVKAVVCAAMLLGLAPAGASAATLVSYSSSSGLSITGDAGGNGVRVVIVDAGSGPVYRLSVANAFAIGGCVPSAASQIDCSITGVRAIAATLGDGADGLTLAAAQPPADNLGPATVDLGPGNDGLSADEMLNKVTADGGDGNDSLFGGSGADTLRGGLGDELLGDGGGIDTLIGGDGDDRLFAAGTSSGEPTPTADVFDGGPGTDFMIYNTETAPVTISLDGSANDGRAGENDNALNAENVVGGRGPNTITGDSGPNQIFISLLGDADNVANDVIHGGDGNDRIGTGKGNDQLFGEGGDDALFGGSGNDMMDAGAGDDRLADDNQTTATVFVPGGPDTIQNPSPEFDPFVPGDDTALGGPGDDSIATSDGFDVQRGGDGNDTIKFRFLTTPPPPETPIANTEVALGEAGNDDLEGSSAVRLTFDGGAGDDRLRSGNLGNDVLDGGSGNDTIDGGSGNDTVRGEGGDDTITNRIAENFAGTAGRDTIFGGPGADTIDTRQQFVQFVTADTVNCGTDPIHRLPENDRVTMNLIDTQTECEQVTQTAAGVFADAHLSSHVVEIPAHGRVPLEISCFKRADHPKCTGTVQLGVISKTGVISRLAPRLAVRPAPKTHFSIRRGRSGTVRARIQPGDRHKLRRGGFRLRVVIVEPGNSQGPSTTVRTLRVKSG